MGRLDDRDAPTAALIKLKRAPHRIAEKVDVQLLIRAARQGRNG